PRRPTNSADRTDHARAKHRRASFPTCPNDGTLTAIFAVGRKFNSEVDRKLEVVWELDVDWEIWKSTGNSEVISEALLQCRRGPLGRPPVVAQRGGAYGIARQAAGSAFSDESLFRQDLRCLGVRSRRGQAARIAEVRIGHHRPDRLRHPGRHLE